MVRSRDRRMRARPFLAVVLVIILAAFGLGLGGWWLVWQRSPLQLQHQALTLPRAARFVPRQAPLGLYFLTDGEQPVGYARAVAPPRQRHGAADAIERLRDGAFAAAGLDYRNELSTWLAPDIGLALLEIGSPEAPVQGWLLALSSRDDEGARRFLQRFWQTRSLAGTDLQVSSYRGMGLISGRGALLGQEPVPLATALVDDDLVLIASGRGVLEQALDVSQIDELNQASLPRLQGAVDRLGSGAALMVARTPALATWLGLPLPAAASDRPTLLLAALRPQGRELILEGLVDLPALADPLPVSSAAAGESPGAALLAAAGNQSPNRLALLQQPAALARVPLLQPLLATLTAAGPAAGPLPPLLAGAAEGPLLAMEGPEGWLIGTPAADPSPEQITAPLAAQGLVPAPLTLHGRPLLAWTRLQAGSGRASEELQVSLAGWRSEEEVQGQAWAWWGRSPALLDGIGGAHGSRALRARQAQLRELDLEQAPLQWALASDGARGLLQPWQPWRLLAALAGGSFNDAVQGLALAVEPEADHSLHWRIRLELG